MLRLSFIVVSLLVFISCNRFSGTEIRLHVKDVTGDDKPKIVTSDSVYQVALDSTGIAIFMLPEGQEPGYATLQYKEAFLLLYVEPGKGFDIELEVDGEGVISHFTGKGAKKNGYLNRDAFQDQHFLPDFKMSEAEFIISLGAYEAEFNTVLDSMGFDARFNEIEKKRLYYLAHCYLPTYLGAHVYMSGDMTYRPSEDYYNKLKEIVREDESLLDNFIYQKVLIEAIGAICSRGLEGDDENFVFLKRQLDFVDKKFTNPTIISYLVDVFISYYVESFGIEHLDKIAPVYDTKVIDPKKKAAFEKLCENWRKITVGQASCDFKYLDIDGKEVSLGDLAGKYIYIDIWATWCAPCCAELPHLAELEHRFAKKNICFVSISCDQNKKAWEKMVKEKKLGGIQLHFGGDRTFMNAYAVSGIPRFILLDREGRILSADMTRPSSPETLKTLNALEGI